jgi:hypothetical protein
MESLVTIAGQDRSQRVPLFSIWLHSHDYRRRWRDGSAQCRPGGDASAGLERPLVSFRPNAGFWSDEVCLDCLSYRIGPTADGGTSMISYRRIAGLVVCILTILAVGSTVQAQVTTSAGGLSCQRTTSSDPGELSGAGASNYSSTVTSHVECPINIGPSAGWGQSVSQVVLRYYDASSTNYFSCYVGAYAWDGSFANSAFKYTCSVAGGCPDATTSYTGSNYLLWNSTDLGSVLTTHFPDWNYRVGCYLPKATSGGSHVIAYYSQS